MSGILDFCVCDAFAWFWAWVRLIKQIQINGIFNIYSRAWLETRSFKRSIIFLTVLTQPYNYNPILLLAESWFCANLNAAVYCCDARFNLVMTKSPTKLHTTSEIF